MLLCDMIGDSNILVPSLSVSPAGQLAGGVRTVIM